MEKLAQEYDTKADLIDELRTLIDSNEDNKYSHVNLYFLLYHFLVTSSK